MFKACIADDERYVRESIRKRVEQSGLNIQIMGMASNGKEAMQLYEKENPDIYFVDIQMPLLNGLDFVEQVRREDKNSKTKFIIISGYDDFKYMKQAIQTNVVNYILKPICQEELIETLEKVCRDLEALKEEEHGRNLILFQDFLEQEPLFSGTAYLFWAEGLLGKVKRTENTEAYFYELFPCEAWTYIRFHETENLLCLLCRQVYVSEQKILEDWTKIRKYMGKEAVLVYKTGKQEHMGNLAEQMAISLNQRFWKGSFQLLRCQQEDSIREVDMESFGKALENTRENHWRPQIERKYEALFSGNMQGKETLLKATQDSLFLLLANLYMKYNWEIPENLKEEFYLFSLAKYRNREELLQKAICCAEELYKKLVSHAEQEGMVEQAVRYMQEHYQENITLTDLANEFFTAPNYLAKKFKDKKNMTAMQYLEAYRIEQAEILLKTTDYQVTEIAGKCGYHDANYFTRAFKKKNQITPKKYRELYQRK